MCDVRVVEFYDRLEIIDKITPESATSYRIDQKDKPSDYEPNPDQYKYWYKIPEIYKV